MSDENTLNLTPKELKTLYKFLGFVSIIEVTNAGMTSLDETVLYQTYLKLEQVVLKIKADEKKRKAEK